VKLEVLVLPSLEMRISTASDWGANWGNGWGHNWGNGWGWSQGSTCGTTIRDLFNLIVAMKVEMMDC